MSTSGEYFPDPDAPIRYDFTSVDDAWHYIRSEIEYRYDTEDGFIDYWQSPTETATLKHGDCEDMAILFAHILTRMGYSPSVAILRYPEYDHAVAIVEGVVYGAIFGREYEIALELCYQDVIASLWKHRKPM